MRVHPALEELLVTVASGQICIQVDEILSGSVNPGSGLRLEVMLARLEVFVLSGRSSWSLKAIQIHNSAFGHLVSF